MLLLVSVIITNLLELYDVVKRGIKRLVKRGIKPIHYISHNCIRYIVNESISRYITKALVPNISLKYNNYSKSLINK